MRFTPAPGDRGTEVVLDVAFVPPFGAAGAAAARLVGAQPELQARDALRRLEQLLEVGEVVRSDGRPQGVRVRPLLTRRRARPGG